MAVVAKGLPCCFAKASIVVCIKADLGSLCHHAANGLFYETKACVQAPIAVYASGKGSSGAGLTASALKDKSGQFFLEVKPCSFAMEL